MTARAGSPCAAGRLDARQPRHHFAGHQERRGEEVVSAGVGGSPPLPSPDTGLMEADASCPTAPARGSAPSRLCNRGSTASRSRRQAFVQSRAEAAVRIGSSVRVFGPVVAASGTLRQQAGGCIGVPSWRSTPSTVMWLGHFAAKDQVLIGVVGDHDRDQQADAEHHGDERETVRGGGIRAHGARHEIGVKACCNSDQ